MSHFPSVQLEGPGLLPFTTDKQNVFLSSVLGIANQQNLPLINLNISSWEAAPASTSGRWVPQTQRKKHPPFVNCICASWRHHHAISNCM